MNVSHCRHDVSVTWLHLPRGPPGSLVGCQIVGRMGRDLFFQVTVQQQAMNRGYTLLVVEWPGGLVGREAGKSLQGGSNCATF